jgi:hypothetical protein
MENRLPSSPTLIKGGVKGGCPFSGCTDPEDVLLVLVGVMNRQYTIGVTPPVELSAYCTE